MSRTMRRFPAISVHYTSVFQTAQRYSRLVTLTAVQSYEALGHQFSRRERERLLWGTGSAVRGIGCTRCVRCWKCKMSTSPSFASSMGYHHHHIGLNSFSWHSVSFKDVPRSKQGYYSTGADYLQGLNFNLRNQSPNPAHVVYVKNHTEPNTAGFIATLMWGNVFNSVGCSWGPWSSKLELALFNTKWVL